MPMQIKEDCGNLNALCSSAAKFGFMAVHIRHRLISKACESPARRIERIGYDFFSHGACEDLFAGFGPVQERLAGSIVLQNALNRYRG